MSRVTLPLFPPHHLPDQGIVLVTGDQKTGKTYLAVFLALIKRTNNARPLVHVSAKSPLHQDNDPYPLFHSSHTSIPYPLPPHAIVVVDDCETTQEVIDNLAELGNGILYIVCCVNPTVPPEYLDKVDAVCFLQGAHADICFQQWLHHFFDHPEAAQDLVRIVTTHPRQYCAVVYTPKGIGHLKANMSLFTFERV